MLLQDIGLAVEFSRDVQDVPIKPDCRYQFIANQGFIEHTQGRYTGQQVLGALRLDKSIAGSLSLARECLAMQLDSALNNRPLQSRVWLKSVSAKG
jgi:hypothetical protein